MESFYGGRNGAAFVIVARFDGVNIPQDESNPTYTITEYAYDSATNKFILTTKENGGNIAVDEENNVYLIAKNNENKILYQTWQDHRNNGEKINDTDYEFPKKRAQGMVQCFAQGAKTTSIVNYGEYVIIDALLNMNEKSNLDNGKIYRRGMDIQNELAGAEYIGQVAGTCGDMPNFDILDYDVVAAGAHKESEYKLGNKGLVPGATTTGGVTKYIDGIKYAYANITDKDGQTTGYKIGFQIPYSVIDIIGTAISPYDPKKSSYNQSKKQLEYSNLSDRIDDLKHPFYQKWNVSIPKGVKGDSFSQMEVITTEPKQGASYYTASKAYVGSIDKATDTYALSQDADAESAEWRKINVNGAEYYIKNIDTEKDIVRCKLTSYNRIEAGDSTFMEVAPYKYVQEYIVAEPDELFPETPEYHLLALYSDDAMIRGQKTYSYYSKTQPPISDKWVDLGNVRGIEVSVKVMGNFETLDDFKVVFGNDLKKPPESRYAGWGYTIGSENENKAFYLYDYDREVWYFAGRFTGENGVKHLTYYNVPAVFIEGDTSYSGYPYRVELSTPETTDWYSADIRLDAKLINLEIFGPMVNTTENKTYIYAKSKPDFDVVIPCIVCTEMGRTE